MPHAVHMPPVQRKFVEQVDPAQHSWLFPPQATQVPSLPHRLPPAHIEPAQQGWPAPPHVPQVPADEQATPVTVQRDPVQQLCPMPPQGVHVDARQTESPLQTSPVQHGCPTAPHVVLMPLSVPPSFGAGAPVSTGTSGVLASGT